MILKTALILKILLATVCAFGTFWLLRKRCEKKAAAILLAVVTVLVGAVLGQKLADAVPPLTDTVTITALGEKNAESKAYEIALTGFTVDGEVYPVGEITSGKWFWFGNDYMWRPETDNRQPDGTTDTIQVEIRSEERRGRERVLLLV